MSLVADLGLAEKRCCSQSLAGSRRRESPRPRRARETSPYTETPWAKSSSSSILPQSIRQNPAFRPTWHRAIVTPQLCFDGTRRCLNRVNAAGCDTCSSSADGRAALREIFAANSMPQRSRRRGSRYLRESTPGQWKELLLVPTVQPRKTYRFGSCSGMVISEFIETPKLWDTFIEARATDSPALIQRQPRMHLTRQHSL